MPASTRLFRLILVGLLAAPVTAALADPLYTITVIGGAGSSAYGINSAGEVVGDFASGSATHGFVYTGGSFTDLGTLGGGFSHANAINDLGQVVGSADTGAGQTHAFLYAGGTMSDLGTMGGTSSIAYAINNQGVIVGTAMTAQQSGGYYSDAFRYQNGTMQDLGALPGGLGSTAYTVNDHGLIAGTSYKGPETVPEYPYYGVTFGNGTVQQLGQLDYDGVVYGSNDLGQLVGRNGDYHEPQAFLYTKGQVINLGTLDAFSNANFAFDINNLGHVVGASDTLSGSHAFLYTGSGSMIDLNTLVDPAGGWEIRGANAINDSDQIAATACKATGECYAVRLDPLSPVPEPARPALLATGLLLLAVRGRRPAAAAFRA